MPQSYGIEPVPGGQGVTPEVQLMMDGTDMDSSVAVAGIDVKLNSRPSTSDVMKVVGATLLVSVMVSESLLEKLNTAVACCATFSVIPSAVQV